MRFEPYIQWVKNHIGCEVYFIQDEQVTNGFVEYRNQGHIIYVIGSEHEMELSLFKDILAHEIGHVLYNQNKMNEGIRYETLIQKTQAKLQEIHSLLENQVISNEEYVRFYASIEEEWESNQERERILDLWAKEL